MSETFFSGRETGFQTIQPGTPARAPFSDVAGATVGQAFDEAPGFGIARWVGRGINNLRATPGGADPLLSPEEATDRFGIPGRLTFNRSMAESSAASLNERARERAAREDILSRADSGAAGWTGRVALSLAASAIDPLNIASAFVPVVGATRSAAWLAQAGSRLGRVGVAARIGAIEGAVGQALLEPVNQFVASQEQRDYGMADTLLNVAFGAGFGAALHAGGRALVDGFRGWSAPPAVAREVHESAVRAAVAQVERGDPIDVGPIFQAGRLRTLDDIAADEAREGRAQFGHLSELLAAGRARAGRTEGEVSLATFLARNGGIQNQGGDLMAVLGSARTRPGLINNRTGMTLEQAAAKAREAGYFPEHNVSRGVEAESLAGKLGSAGRDMETMTPADLLRALDEEMRGKPRFGNTLDEKNRELSAAIDDLDEQLSRHGLTFRDSDDDIFRALRQVEENPRPLTEAEVMGGPAPDVQAAIQSAARTAMRPEDARAVAAADAARVRTEAAPRKDAPGAQAEAEAAALDAQIAETDAVFAELARTGRITEADLRSVGLSARPGWSEVVPGRADVFRVSRRDGAGFDPSAPRAQGLYASIVDNPRTFKSLHEDEGAEVFEGVARAENPLALKPLRVRHERGRGMEIEASAGIAALAKFSTQDEFAALVKMNKGDVAAILGREFPAVDASRYSYDAYELLEVLGAQRAKAAGHDALVLRAPDVAGMTTSEAVIIDPRIVEWRGDAPEPAAPSGVESIAALEAKAEAKAAGFEAAAACLIANGT